MRETHPMRSISDCSRRSACLMTFSICSVSSADNWSDFVNDAIFAVWTDQPAPSLRRKTQNDVIIDDRYMHVHIYYVQLWIRISNCSFLPNHISWVLAELRQSRFDEIPKCKPYPISHKRVHRGDQCKLISCWTMYLEYHLKFCMEAISRTVLGR